MSLEIFSEVGPSGTDSVSDRDRGATMAEYILVVTAVAVVALLGVRFFGTQVSALFDVIASRV